MASDVIVNLDGGESYLLEYYSKKVAIVYENLPQLSQRLPVCLSGSSSSKLQTAELQTTFRPK